MERLLIGYALVLLICVWIYPNNSLEINLLEGTSRDYQNNLSDDSQAFQASTFSQDSGPILNDAQIKTAVTELGGLPKSKYPRLQGAYMLTKLIKMNEDCKMEINENYESVNGEKIQILAKAEFPAGSFDKDTEVTMVIDNKTGAASFFPQVDFSKNAKFSMEVVGMGNENTGAKYYNVGSSVQPAGVKKMTAKEDKDNLALNSSDLSGI